MKDIELNNFGLENGKLIHTTWWMGGSAAAFFWSTAPACGEQTSIFLSLEGGGEEKSRSTCVDQQHCPVFTFLCHLAARYLTRNPNRNDWIRRTTTTTTTCIMLYFSRIWITTRAVKISLSLALFFPLSFPHVPLFTFSLSVPFLLPLFPFPSFSNQVKALPWR